MLVMLVNFLKIVLNVLVNFVKHRATLVNFQYGNLYVTVGKCE